MALATDKIGTAYGGDATQVVDPEQAKAYAAATNDDNTAYESGKYAPPVFAVAPTWGVMGLAVADVVPADAMLMVVHGEQDMHFHRPVVPGMTLRTRSEPFSVRVGGSGTRYTIRVRSDDEEGTPIVEQYVTMFIRGMTDGESAGADKPDHTFPEDARAALVGEFGVHVDDDQTYRYSKASGDMMPIHLDADIAKSVGLPGIIAHGLCTMAMCSQAVLKTVAGGDPARLKRLAVRFAANVFPGNDVVTRIHDAGERDGLRVYAFEAESAGATVIKNGLAEVEA